MRLIKSLAWGLPLSAMALGVFFWLRDEPPVPLVQDWLQQVQVHDGQPSAAYLFLAGLDAAPRTSPAVLGASRLAAYQDWLAAHGSTAHDFRPARSTQLPLPTGPAFCSIDSAQCFDHLLQRQAELPALLSEHAALLGRYRHFLQLRDYRTLSSPGLAEPLPPLQYLIRGQQLLTLQVLQLALAGDGAAALALLQEDQAGVRQHLARADQLALKMTLVSLFNRNLEWLSRLYRRGLLTQPVTLPPLQPAERSLRLPLQREFATGTALLQNLRQEDVAALLEEASMFFEYKPQMTINASLALYSRAVQLSELAPAAFQQALHQQPASQVPYTGLRNRVGNILLGISGANFVEQAGQVQDLDSKIRLAAFSLRLGQEAVGPLRLGHLARTGGVGNPYVALQLPYVDGQQRLCFRGPLPQREGGRCVRL